MKYILPFIVILLAASVLAQELDEKCYWDCYNNCVGKADAKYCGSICRESCTPEKITTPKEEVSGVTAPAETVTTTCEDGCRERISNNNPEELEQCLQDCQPPETCEERCEREFRGVPVKIQECYMRECGHPRPVVMSCEEICRQDYGKDERQFRGCMAKRCLVTAYVAPAEVAPPPPPETTAIIPRDEIYQPGCPRQPESRCQRCENEYQECIGTLPEESQARQQGYDTCNEKVIRCLNGCLFGVIAEANEPTLKPRPELSQQSLWSRIWNSFVGN